MLRTHLFIKVGISHLLNKHELVQYGLAIGGIDIRAISDRVLEYSSLADVHNKILPVIHCTSAQLKK